MDKTLDLIEFESLEDTSQQPLCDHARNSCDTPKVLHAMASSQIDAEFGITKRQIQLWFPLVCQAYPWMPESQLRSGGGKYVKYSPFCIQQFLAIQQAKAEGKSGEQWVSEIHTVNQERLQAHTTAKHNSTAAIIPANPSSLQIDPPGDLYALIDQELARQKLAESDTIAALTTFEAELVEVNQQFDQSQDKDREARRREIQRLAIQDAIADERDYQTTYIATRNRLRVKKQG